MVLNTLNETNICPVGFELSEFTLTNWYCFDGSICFLCIGKYMFADSCMRTLRLNEAFGYLPFPIVGVTVAVAAVDVVALCCSHFGAPNCLFVACC